MTREYLFRGIREDNGEWVYGSLIGNNVIVGPIIDFNDEYFNTEFWWKVIPETVGQYLGWEDKADNKIFFGDLISEDGSNPYEVIWQEYAGQLIMQSVGVGRGYRDMSRRYLHKYEIIGNRWDNPELLKGG